MRKTVRYIHPNRCVLFSSVVGQPVEDKRLVKAIRSGTPRDEESMMYLGPSMTIARRQALSDSVCPEVGMLGEKKKVDP